jgi:hypothetical protein
MVRLGGEEQRDKSISTHTPDEAPGRLFFIQTA